MRHASQPTHAICGFVILKYNHRITHLQRVYIKKLLRIIFMGNRKIGVSILNLGGNCLGLISVAYWIETDVLHELRCYFA